MLATPTHRHGWLDPRALVRRMRQLDERESELHVADFIQALLRLAPNGRAEAVSEASTLATKWGRILRWAMGDDNGPTSDDQGDYALWLAAARARGPHADWSSELAALRLSDGLPDGVVPATFVWKARMKKQKAYATTDPLPELEINVEPVTGTPNDETEAPKDGSATDNRSTASLLGAAITRLASGEQKTRWQDVPTTILTRTQSRHFWNSFLPESEWLVKWLALTWPLNPEAIFATGAKSLAGRVDQDSSSWWPHHAYLEPLFERARTWREMAVLVLSVALVSKDADASALARDALIAASRMAGPIPTVWHRFSSSSLTAGG